MQTDREILFVVDERRNNCKTWLCNYLEAVRDAQIFENTIKKDVAYALDPKGNTFVFDITRQVEQHITLSTLEAIKSGRVFSGKYESVTKKLKDPKIASFLQ